MGVVKITEFMGYSTKPDLLIDNPGMASDCNSVIINRGDLVNRPGKIAKIKEIATVTEPIAGFYRIFNRDYVVIYFTRGGINPTDLETAHVNIFRVLNNEISNNVTHGLTNFFNNVTTSVITTGTGRGNWFQVGDWMFLLELFGVSQSAVSPIPKPRMVRIAKTLIQGRFQANQSPNAAKGFIGVTAPLSGFVRRTDTSAAGDLSGTFDFAFTFITDAESEVVLGLNNLESTANTLDSSLTITSRQFTYKLYLPVGTINLDPIVEPHRDTDLPATIRSIGIYARVDDQTLYYFYKYVSVTVGIAIEPEDAGAFAGLSFVTIVIGATGDGDITIDDLDITRPAPFTGATGPILGAHEIPRPSFHGAFYKGRMYYLSIPGAEIVKNRLEISARTPDGTDETGQYANYIEDQAFIGNANQRGSGLIEFLGQLIIFKEKETWLLTDEQLLGGRFRLLWGDLGCVNKDGGHGYIVIKDILYWADENGIYAYTGDDRPVRISEDINEDILALDKDKYAAIRFSADERYGLIYMYVPGVITFIYNYLENKWTKTSAAVSGFFQLRDGRAYEFQDRETERLGGFVTPNLKAKLFESGTLQEDNLEEQSRDLDPLWKSSAITLGEQDRKKHWRTLKLNSINFIRVAFNHAPGSAGFLLGLEEKAGGDIIPVREHKDELLFRLVFDPKKKFRLNGFELNAHIRGRR